VLGGKGRGVKERRGEGGRGQYGRGGEGKEEGEGMEGRLERELVPYLSERGCAPGPRLP